MPGQELSALLVGTWVREFEIRAVLGGGQFSLIYKTYDHSLERTVALKEYLPTGVVRRGDSAQVEILPDQREQFAQGLKRFRDEARAMTEIRHPVLRETLQMVEANGTAYIVMPYYDGKTLRQCVHEDWRAKNLDDLFSIILPILEGVSLLHQAGYCHLNISPGNILMQENGAPVLLDFGATQRPGKAKDNRLMTELSPGFAAKEQYDPDGDLGSWTDIYAISAVVYYIITGIIPPLSISRSVFDPLEPLASFATDDLPGGMLSVVDLGLSVEPETRIRNIASYTKTLRDVAQKTMTHQKSIVKMISVDEGIPSLSRKQLGLFRYVLGLHEQFRSNMAEK
jgi:non-specific serine/threonine protein kinase